MGLKNRLGRWFMVGALLSFWELYGKPLYQAWLESQGRMLGFWELTLAYVGIFATGWVLGRIIFRDRGVDTF